MLLSPSLLTVVKFVMLVHTLPLQILLQPVPLARLAINVLQLLMPLERQQVSLKPRAPPELFVLLLVLHLELPAQMVITASLEPLLQLLAALLLTSLVQEMMLLLIV